MAADPFRLGLPSDLIAQLREALDATDATAGQGLAIVLASAVKQLAARESSILTPDGDDFLKFFASTNPDLLGENAPEVPIGRSIAGFVFLTGQTTAMDKAADNPKYYSKVDSYLADKATEPDHEPKDYSKTKEYIAAPIVRGDAILGVLTFVNRSDPERTRFGKDDIFLATRYAELCGLLLDHIGRVSNQSAIAARALEASFTDDKPKEWLASPLMSGGPEADVAALRAQIGAALEDLVEHDLKLVRGLVERLTGEHPVA